MNKFVYILVLLCSVASITTWAQYSTNDSSKSCHLSYNEPSEADIICLDSLKILINAAIENQDFTSVRLLQVKRLSKGEQLFGKMSSDYLNLLYEFGVSCVTCGELELAKELFEGIHNDYKDTDIDDSTYIEALSYLGEIYSYEGSFSHALSLDHELEVLILSSTGNTSDRYIELTWKTSQDYLKAYDTDKAMDYMVTCYLSLVAQHNTNHSKLYEDERYLLLMASMFSLLDIDEDGNQLKIELMRTPFINEIDDIYSYESMENMLALSKYFLYHNDYSNVKFLSSFLNISIPKLAGTESQEYADFLYYNIEAGSRINDEEYTLSFISKADSAAAIWPQESYKLFLIRYAEASAYYSLHKYGHAEEKYHQLESLIPITKPTLSNIKKANSYGLGSQIFLKSNPSKALLCIQHEMALREIEGVRSFSGFTHLASYQQSVKDYDSAIENYWEAIECLDTMNLTETQKKYSLANYYSTLLSISSCMREMGHYADAIAYVELAMVGIEKYAGINSYTYAGALIERALYYNEIYYFEKSLEDSERAISILESTSNNMSKNYYAALNNAGLSAMHLQQYEKSIGYFNRAQEVLISIYGEDCIDLLGVYVNLWEVSCRLSEVEKQRFYLEECERLVLQNKLEKSIYSYSLYSSIGSKMLDTKDERAEYYLAKSLDIAEEIGLDKSPEYLYYSIAYYRTVLTKSNISEDKIDYLVNLFKEQYYDNFAFYLQNERDYYLSSPQFTHLKNVLFEMHHSDSSNESLYDYILFSKGLLLDTSLSLETAILNSNDCQLTESYNNLVSLRSRLSKDIDKECDIHLMDSLKIEVDKQERVLLGVAKEKLDFRNIRNCEYKDVVSVLRKNEYVVEFVEYNGHYAALIGKNGWSSPKFVSLCGVEELKRLLGSKPSVLYGDNTHISPLYEKLWSPIESLIRKGSTVYFAPDGLLNIISIESISMGNYKCLCEVYNIKRCSSTRFIARHSDDNHQSDITLFGGINYSSQESNEICDIFAKTDESATRCGWEYLPGTKEEVINISKICERNNIPYTLYVGNDGDERTFKSLSKTHPKQMHIATHGYYLDEKNFSKIINQSLRRNSIFSKDTLNSHLTLSLSRSGLLLAGANRTWLDEKELLYSEDGVLTAAEIASMDLTGTSLVVLSACQTGLGDIYADGVFGLQRAFKLAGAETLIMTLWEVDDASTSLFMSTFYEHYLSGNTKNDAFRKARNIVRAQYEDPYYWAGFIMLD